MADDTTTTDTPVDETPAPKATKVVVDAPGTGECTCTNGYCQNCGKTTD